MKTIVSVITVALTIVSAILISSCNNDDEPTYLTNVVSSLNDVCIEWGTAREDVMGKMEKFKLTYSDEENLVYTGSNENFKITYTFAGNRLDCSSLIITLDDESESFDPSEALKQYHYVGCLNSYDVYEDSSKNVLVLSQLFIPNDQKRVLFAFTSLE